LLRAHPGFYAVCGAAAMLSGFTHMSLAIVVLLIEASMDLELTIPLMVSIIVSTTVNKVF
jgi:H+/Cl- antiporter ClcA